jgi:hypothetical protein
MAKSRRRNDKRRSLRKRGGVKSRRPQSATTSKPSAIARVEFKPAARVAFKPAASVAFKPAASVAFKPAASVAIDDYIHWATSDRILEKLIKEHPSQDRTQLDERLKGLAIDHANKIQAARDFLEKNPRGKVGVVYYHFNPSIGLTRKRVEADITKELFDDMLKERYFTELTYFNGLYPRFEYIPHPKLY